MHVYSHLTYIEVKYPLIGNEPPPGTLVPKPQFINSTSAKKYLLVRNKFNITSNMETECDIIEEAKKLYLNILFPPNFSFSDFQPGDELLTELSITVNSSCPGYPNSDMDESYEIEINNGTAHLNAETVWGVLRGLESFSQLTYVTEEKKLSINDSTYINDYPRFKHRGVMIDVSRHFIPIKVLMKQIDAMSYSKFNVLHLHLVDDQSWSYESLRYPNLSKNGAYSDKHVYTQDDLKNLINHARLRGIRVIPEFDSPGHTQSFGKSFPELLTVCWNNGLPNQAIYGVQAAKEILNPTLNELYPILKEVLSEIKDIFPDEFVHLGNDEVYYDCWKSNPNISEWMKEMNFKQYSELEAFYSSNILQIAHDLKKKVTIWQDPFENGVKLDLSTQIQIWKDSTSTGAPKSWNDYLYDVTKSGYKAILSSPWYINFLSYGFEEWYKYYKIEPTKNWRGTREQLNLLLGGEACLWGEYVDTSNIQTRLWPRASVIAERLWSDSSVNDPEEAKYRIDEMRCRLLRRGIIAAPISPNGYCGDFEVDMGNSVINEKVFNY